MNAGAEASLWIALVAAALVVLAVAWRRFRVWLASMKTAVGLLATVAVLTVLGVLVGQGLPPEAYVDRYGHALGVFAVRTGLTSIFTSWYFLLAVWTLALSVLTCSLGRARGLTRSFARGGLPRIGSLLTHLSIIVVLAGGVVTALWGFRYLAPRYLGAGDEVEIPEGGFSLRVEEARTEFTAEGALSEYVSVVTVIENAREVGTRRIEVNHPLVHRGVGVYQYEMLPAADSVADVLLGIVVPAGENEDRLLEVTAPFRGATGVPGTDLSLKVLEFLADFTYDIDRGTAELASVWHDNPAVLVQVCEADRVVGETWLFPGLRGHRGEPDLPCRLVFLDYRPDYEHGLTRFEFSSQPGTPLLYVGFAVMSLGLCLTFWGRRP